MVGRHKGVFQDNREPKPTGQLEFAFLAKAPCYCSPAGYCHLHSNLSPALGVREL